MDDVSEAQERLGRVLDRARAGEDRALAATVREEGERLVRLLNGVLAMARLHAADNHAFDQPMRDLESVLGRLAELLGTVHLLAVEDQVYVNDIRIRLEGSEAAQDFGARLRLHGTGGISFHAALPEASCRLLVASLAAPADPDRPRAALQAALEAKGLSDAVELVGVHHFRVAGGKEPARTRDAKAIAATAVALADEAWTNLAASRVPNPLPVRRVVLEILEEGATGEALLGDPEGATPYAAHTLRVCRLALLLGEALGLSAGALQDLGVAAMFHDIGYAAREGVELRDGRASGGEAPPFARHVTAGARVLLRQRGFHEAKVRRLLATLDHHRRYDDPRGRPSLFGRLLAIVEDYDTWIAPRGGGASPAEALGRLFAGAGSVYDPTLVQLFANALGRFPPGTLLQLADGRQARVVSLARSPETFDAPLVRIERLADDSPPPGTTILDLSQHAELAPKPVAERAVASEAATAPEPVPAPPPEPASAPQPATDAAEPAAGATEPEAVEAAAGPDVAASGEPIAKTEAAAATKLAIAPAETPFEDWTQLDDGLPDDAHAEPASASASASASAPETAPEAAPETAPEGAPEVASETAPETAPTAAATVPPSAAEPPAVKARGPAQGPAPAGTGALSAGARPLFPGALPQILRDIYAGRRSGFLTLIRGHERRGVRFWNGSIMYGRSNVYEEQMGMLGVRLGLFSEEDLERASGIARRENERLGDVLCGLGLLTSDGLRDLVARHARQVLEKAIPWTKGSFEFEVTTEEPTWFERLPSSLSTADIILEAARAIEDAEVIAWHLGDVDRVVVPASETPAEATSCRLTAFDGFVLSRADGRLTAREIMSIVPNDAEDVQRALFGLLCIGFVHYGVRRGGASG